MDIGFVRVDFDNPSAVVPIGISHLRISLNINNFPVIISIEQ